MARRITAVPHVLFVMVSMMTVTTCVFADNWPRFRGPNGTGISSDRDVPIQWDEKVGVRWKVAIPGVGNSSPIIWGDRLFLQSASDDGKKRTLLCLSVANGKTMWNKSVSSSSAHIHRKNSFASSTPATDGERVYAVFWDGQEISLHAFDFQGEPLWKQPIGGFASQHGPGMSPIICGDKVILANDQDGSSTLLAFDAKTGKPAWKSPRPAFRTCYSTPCLLEKPGETPELIVASTAGITSYNPQTGTENWNWTWSFSGQPLRTVASPVLGQGLVFVQSGDGSGDRHTVAIRMPNGDKKSGPSLAWELKRAFPYVPTALSWDKHVFFVNDRGIAACYLAETGAPVWTERLGGDVSASPILIDGKIYAINEGGDVFVLLAAPEFKLLAKNSLGEPVTATPAVANNQLFIRGKSHLFCIGRDRK